MYCFAGAITSPQWGTQCARLAKVVFKGNALPDDICVPLSESSLKTTCTLRHTHFSLNDPLAFSEVMDLFSAPGYGNRLTVLVLSALESPFLKGRIKCHKSPVGIGQRMI